jgi:hypothetical protein
MVQSGGGAQTAAPVAHRHRSSATEVRSVKDDRPRPQSSEVLTRQDRADRAHRLLRPEGGAQCPSSLGLLLLETVRNPLVFGRVVPMNRVGEDFSVVFFRNDRVEISCDASLA